MLVMVVFFIAFRSEERFSRNAETDLVCRLLLEKKNTTMTRQLRVEAPSLGLRTAWPSDVLLHVAVVRTRGEGFDLVFFFNAAATTEIYTLSLHDALPISTSSTLYFDSLTVNAGNGGFLHCI